MKRPSGPPAPTPDAPPAVEGVTAAAIPAGSTELVTALGRHRVVAVVRHRDAGAAAEIARGCIAGGLGLIEITLTTPGACSLITELVADVPDGVLVGAGTVLDAAQVEAATSAGARFLVSPATDPAAMAAAAAAGVPLVPGAATPSEIATAARFGAPVVKVFPAGGLGLSFLSAVVAVMPHVPLLPSGGIGVRDVPAWLDAGALAIAIGSELNAAHARGGLDAVTELAAEAATNAGPFTAATLAPTTTPRTPS